MKRRLHRWAYAAAGLAIMIAAMIVFAPSDTAVQDAVPAAANIETDPLLQFILEQEQLRSMQICAVVASAVMAFAAPIDQEEG